jgi:hypothetical protein
VPARFNTRYSLAVIRPTPAIVTQLAARRLPRWVLLVLGVLYIVPGFWGRDPWRTDELASFGVMLELAGGSGSWAQPGLLGEAALTPGWLPYWLGAWSIQIAGVLPPDLAVKLPFVGLLGLTLASTWYGVFHLARLPGAQPVVFAFGGEAHPVDYARATADAALLALVASLGLAMLAHETTPDAARLACVALAFHAAARSLSVHARHHHKTLWLWWLSAWGLALSGAPLLALWLGGLTALPHLATSVLHLPRQPTMHRYQVALGCLGTVLATAVVSVGLSEAGLGPIDLSPVAVWAQPEAWQRLGRLLLWFTWPSGLLALWAMWRWRRQWRSAHWLLPVAWMASVLALMWWEGGRDRTLLLALPMLACLAAFALPTLRRSVSACLDWFALLFFTGGAVIIWVFWLAMTAGVPSRAAAQVARLAPRFEPSFVWWLWLPAVGATLGWLAIVVWRMGRHRPALWKSLVLSASGGTLCWVLLMTLWLPLLNHGMGQASVSQRLAALLPPQACVWAVGLNHAQITGLLYHGQLDVKRWEASQAQDCDWLVTDGEPALSAIGMGWALRHQLPRLRESRETWRVYQRTP